MSSRPLSLQVHKMLQSTSVQVRSQITTMLLFVRSQRTQDMLQSTSVQVRSQITTMLQHVFVLCTWSGNGRDDIETIEI